MFGIKQVIPVLFISFGFANALHAAQPSFQGLGDLPGGGFESYAWAVSADGQAVVGRGRPSYHAGIEGFVWTKQDDMVALGGLGGELYSNAFGVSANGTIVVGLSTYSEGVIEAFCWEIWPHRSFYSGENAGSVLFDGNREQMWKAFSTLGLAMQLWAANKWSAWGFAMGKS